MDYFFEFAFLLRTRSFGGWIDNANSFEILEGDQLQELPDYVQKLAEDFYIARFYDANGKAFGGVVLNEAQEIDLRTYTNKNYLCISSPYTKDEEKKIKEIVHLQ